MVLSHELGAHEQMEIHELLNLNTLALAKSKAMDGMVTDPHLKALLQKSVEQTLRAVADLTALSTQAGPPASGVISRAH